MPKTNTKQMAMQLKHLFPSSLHRKVKSTLQISQNMRMKKEIPSVISLDSVKKRKAHFHLKSCEAQTQQELRVTDVYPTDRGLSKCWSHLNPQSVLNRSPTLQSSC